MELGENVAADESVHSLWLHCHSMNGVTVNGEFVEEGERMDVGDGCSFVLGDPPSLKESEVQEFRFTLHRTVDEANESHVTSAKRRFGGVIVFFFLN